MQINTGHTIFMRKPLGDQTIRSKVKNSHISILTSSYKGIAGLFVRHQIIDLVPLIFNCAKWGCCFEIKDLY